ncbi:MAG TPA: choice-of-anchor D domain-containing protein [Candidatus Sulfotelmatobacter sp.]|nr:choice-of-anchor D domain-containing protein [Candidatus Sulfotelmatobacter sp.]
MENSSSPTTLPLTLTNSGGIALAFSAASTNPDYGLDLSQCSQHFFISPGSSCVVNISFAPTITGPDPAALVITAAISDNNHPVGQGSVALNGSGHPLRIGFDPFGLQLVGGTYQAPVSVFNSSFAPVKISAVSLSGSGFTRDNGCIGTLAPRSFCDVNITFTPTSNVFYNATLTVADEDPTSPQKIAITGTGTALKVNGLGMGFGEQRLLTSSPPQNVVLTNIGKLPVTFQAAANDATYHVTNNCKSKVPAGGSCTVSVTYRPAVNGADPSQLIITPADPIGPQRFVLSGLGVGIGNRKVRLHYDYMVAPDHTHDPEVVAPGAIQRLVEAFALHGVELIVDPHHTAIPEIETITFSQGELCDTSQGNFFTVRDQYFVPKFPDEHYTIFAHNSTDPQVGCVIGAETGHADLPGLNFVVGLARLQTEGFASDIFSMFVSGTTMHELGHNFGLEHGGQEDRNYKPNYLSVMSYAHQLTGIVQGAAVGSSTFSSCAVDSNCSIGQSCIAKSCRRLDYSSQALPIGGNTPGFLDEDNLDEVAGLGSNTADLFSFSTCDSLANTVASTGPVDWDGDGVADNRHLAKLIDFLGQSPQPFNPDCITPPPLITLAGFNDWAFLLGTSSGNDDGQDNSSIGIAESPTQPRLPSSSQPRSVPEVSMDEARHHHVLLAPRPASLVIQPGCLANSPNAIVTNRTITMAVLGSPGFDVTQIDLSSLRFHRARPLSTAVVDVNGDGIPDLVIQVPGADVHLSPESTRARLTGWLGNSQVFVAEAGIDLAAQNAMATCTWQ